MQLVGLLVLATAGKEHPRLLLAIYAPLIVLGVAAAFIWMDNLSVVKNEKRAMREVSRDRHTWVMSFLYIGTFGSFIGFGFAFGQVLSTQFPSHFWGSALVNGKHVVDPVSVAYLTFLGPLIGSLIRPVGGMMADKWGGARTTFWNFVAMAVGAAIVLTASKQDSLPLFMVGFLLLFILSGVGNGSTYKMIPAIFRSKAQLEVAAGTDDAASRSRRPAVRQCVDRYRRRDGGLRRGAGQRGFPPVVPEHQDGGRGVPRFPGVLRAVLSAHLGGVPAAQAGTSRRRLSHRLGGEREPPAT